jgi:hypothetical protein
MSMERLQSLIRAEQAAHLRELSRVREAIDQAFPQPRAPQRRASWARFNALPVVTGGTSPDALEALLDDRVAKLLPTELIGVLAFVATVYRLHPLRRLDTAAISALVRG